MTVAKGEIVPHLAKSWEISEDGLTYTFHLRDDAKFQDGTAVKAADLAWSIQRLLGINKGPSNLIVGVLKPENVTAPDDATLVMKIERQFSPFMAATPLMMAMNKTLTPFAEWFPLLLGRYGHRPQCRLFPRLDQGQADR